MNYERRICDPFRKQDNSFLFMEMQTGSTNNGIYKIVFVFAAPVYRTGGIS
jgi:hypothetical protein